MNVNLSQRHGATDDSHTAAQPWLAAIGMVVLVVAMLAGMWSQRDALHDYGPAVITGRLGTSAGCLVVVDTSAEETTLVLLDLEGNGLAPRGRQIRLPDGTTATLGSDIEQYAQTLRVGDLPKGDQIVTNCGVSPDDSAYVLIEV